MESAFRLAVVKREERIASGELVVKQSYRLAKRNRGRRDLLGDTQPVNTDEAVNEIFEEDLKMFGTNPELCVVPPACVVCR